MINLKHLETFRMVVETENLSQAAKKLNYTQPTISKHLMQLETDMGIPLFKKSQGKRELTKYGKILYKYSLVLLKDMYFLSSEIKSTKENQIKIRLGGLDQFLYSLFLPHIQDFKRESASFSYELISGSSDETIYKLEHNQLDFGIVIGREVSTDFESYCLGYENLYLIASKKTIDYALSHHMAIDQIPVLTDRKASFIYRGIIKRRLINNKVIHCESDEVIYQGVKNGHFLGLGGSFLFERDLKYDRERYVILQEFNSNVPVKLVTQKTTLENQYLKDYYDSFIRYLKSLIQK
ncbi:LysR family transcriptional regulator [Bacillus sp. B-jedd]|uniref:LysR family transcriptional regulator n=1 Tax=Bacillus sp. B-jedd TaxID=1476857 RepID=UPI00051571AF|nr:LysR family transcriptional regulator [Bacillus sp. B-jedd]CEG28611.1 putative HTH-type transcriptional regulator ywbI [Bacillus sp. B-jedd]